MLTSFPIYHKRFVKFYLNYEGYRLIHTGASPSDVCLTKGNALLNEIVFCFCFLISSLTVVILFEILVSSSWCLILCARYPPGIVCSPGLPWAPKGSPFGRPLGSLGLPWKVMRLVLLCFPCLKRNNTIQLFASFRKGPPQHVVWPG